jgi:type I restriction enzyme S subunit
MGAAGQNGFHDTALAHGPGVVVGRSGASFGQVHFCPIDYWPHNTGLYVTDFKGNNPRFAYYFLKAINFDRYNSGSAQPSLNRNYIYPIPIRVPAPDEQNVIAGILGVLDDKIELNRRTNATLESMARALFQSWFTDFDPVRAKLDGLAPTGLDRTTAAFFPSQFQDSSIGPIPLGWRVAKIGDLASRIAMGPFGSRITRDNFVQQGVPVVRGGNLTDGFIDDDFVFLTPAKADELKSAAAKSLDIVFTHRGTLGQVGMIPPASRYPSYIVSQSQMLLSVDRQKASPWMLYLFFRSPRGEADMLSHTSTTGVPAISRPTTSLKAIQVVVPPQAVTERFNELVQPLFLQYDQNVRQSRTLAALRDTLLPKLLSGEIILPHARDDDAS